MPSFQGENLDFLSLKTFPNSYGGGQKETHQVIDLWDTKVKMAMVLDKTNFTWEPSQFLALHPLVH